MLIVHIFNLLGLIQLIVISMEGSATETDQVIGHTVTYLMNNLNYQIFAKETLKKMPEHTFNAINRLKENIIFVGNIPKPIYKRELIMQEEQMPKSPPKEKLLPSRIPLRRFSQSQLKTPSTGNLSRRRNMSRYAPTADKKQFINQIHLDLSQVKQNKVIEIINRPQQNTAKTFHSAIELDSQISEMRKTYLKNLKKKAQLNMTQSKQDFPSKKKRLPKQFTFDFSGQLLQKRNLAAKGVIFSPLKTKSVGIQKIHKKVQESRNYSQEESVNLQEFLERAETDSAQKKKREYNNLSRRQISHIPYINLMQNTKLFQNDAKIEGQSKNQVKDSTFYSSRKSSFTQYRQQNKEKDDLNLNMTQYTFPKSFKPVTKQKIGQGKIIKSKALDGQIYSYDFYQEETQDRTEKQIILNKKI